MAEKEFRAEKRGKGSSLYFMEPGILPGDYHQLGEGGKNPVGGGAKLAIPRIFTH